MNSTSDTQSTNLGDLIPDVDSGRVALIDIVSPGESAEITASELDKRIRGFALGLCAHGVSPGDSVGFLSANLWEFLVGYLGTMYCGAVAVPINFKLPRDTIEHICSDSSIKLMFHDSCRKEIVPSGLQAIQLDGEESRGLHGFLCEGEIEPYRPDTEHLAEILYTSGSTGLPKGVPLSHAGQLWALRQDVSAVPNGDGVG